MMDKLIVQPAMNNLDQMQDGIKTSQPKETPSQIWRTVGLGDIVEVLDKQRKPINELQRRSIQGKYPYCGANGILDYVDGYLFEGEYILLAEDGGYWEAFENSAYLMNGRFWANNHVHILRAVQGIVDSRFLAYQLNYLNIEQFISGTTRGKLNQGVMQKIPILLPSLPEQSAIALVLQTIQDITEARRREIALEREHKMVLMQYLFTYGLNPLNNTSQVSVRDATVSLIPSRWTVVSLDSVAKLVSGGTPSKQNIEWWKGTIPWASPKDLKQPRLWDTQDHISKEALEHGSRLVPAKTLFIVVRGMILAKSIPIALTEVPMAFNQDIKAIIPYSHVDPEYLLYALEWCKNNLTRSIGTSAHGTRRVGTASLEELLIPLPPLLEEQREIALILYSLETKITLLERELQLLEELFYMLLEEFMTGRLSTLPLIEKEIYNERMVSGTETDDSVCNSDRMEIRQAR